MPELGTDYLEHTYLVILCGGGGTRLWPRSVKAEPKQFINFFSEQTLYQEAAERARTIVPENRIIIITNKDYVGEIQRDTPWVIPENIIAEPVKKNTALAMGVAAAYVYKRDPEAVIVNFASDHTVEDEDEAKKTILAAARTAFSENILVAVGIEPSSPHTGYGYIRVGEQLESVDGLPTFKTVEFKEKPSLELAKQFLTEGGYYWNANWYTWSAKAVLAAFAQYAPDLYQNINKILQAIGTPEEQQILETEYLIAREDQIDTAISEKAQNLVLIPGRFGWNDIGSWSVVYDLSQKDGNQNVILRSRKAKAASEVLIQDSKNCLVHYTDQIIALVGVENLVVVDTGRALLVCNKDKSQDVKKIVEILKSQNKEEYL